MDFFLFLFIIDSIRRNYTKFHTSSMDCIYTYWRLNRAWAQAQIAHASSWTIFSINQKKSNQKNDEKEKLTQNFKKQSERITEKCLCICAPARVRSVSFNSFFFFSLFIWIYHIKTIEIQIFVWLFIRISFWLFAPRSVCIESLCRLIKFSDRATSSKKNIQK